MLGQKVKHALLGSAAAGALLMGLGMSPAGAVPVFTITPDAIPGITGYSPSVQSDLLGSSDALVQQTGPSTQFEQGWIQILNYTNNGAGSTFLTTGLFSAPLADTYGMYAKFSATVTGITGFGANQSGTIAPGGFHFSLFADIGDNDVFTAGATSASGGTAPTVTDTGGNDVVLAEATSIIGSAGFQPGTGAPIFAATSAFVLCDGVGNQGLLGGTLVTGGAATGCGTFDATKYFTAPVPFYNINFTSSTTGSAGNISANTSGTPPNATLNGIAIDANFTSDSGTRYARNVWLRSDGNRRSISSQARAGLAAFFGNEALTPRTQVRGVEFLRRLKKVSR